MLRLTLTLLVCLSSQFAIADDFVETKSQEGKFKIQMPGPSRYLSRNLGDVKLHMFVSEADNGNTAYMLMYNDFSAAVINAKTTDQLLDDAVRGAVRNSKSTLISKQNIYYDGYPGRDFVATKETGGFTTIKWRIILVDNRMYQIGVVRVGQNISDSLVNKIRASLTIYP